MAQEHFLILSPITMVIVEYHDTWAVQV